MSDRTERRPREATEGDEENTWGARSLSILSAPESTREDATQARCELCGHPISKPSSVARGTGPICAARVVDLGELEGVRGGDRTV